MSHEKPWNEEASATAAPANAPTEVNDPAPVPLADIAEGESTTMQGSGRDPYVLKNVGGVYSCSCPAWRNAGGPIDSRSCKHLRKLRGDAAENHRVGQAPSRTGTGTAAPRPRPATTSSNSAGGAAATESEGPPVLLAHAWDNVSDLATWWMSEKLDGVRAYWDGERFLSRLGNEFFAPQWFIEKLPKHPLDGELWGGRKNFQRTVSTVRRQDRSEAWREVRYVVFDMPALREPFETRYEELVRVISELELAHVEAHLHTRCTDLRELRAELARVEALGGEGLMMRRPGSLYEVGRSHTLLKVKTFHDAEARVVGHLPGAGKHKGRLGALECEMPNGIRFSAGTGLSDDERNHPPPVGSIITYRYQELSKDGVPRFPSYVGVRDDAVFPPRTEAIASPGVAPNAHPTANAHARPTSAIPSAEATATEDIQYRRFDREGKSWEISLDGKAHRVRRVLSDGGLEKSQRSFPTTVAAWRDAERRVQRKLEAGYVEIDPDD